MIVLEGMLRRWFVSAGSLGLAGLGEGLDPGRMARRWAAYMRGRLRHGDFVFVTKTLTDGPRRGNFSWWRPWRSVLHPTPGTMVNAVSLTNPGLRVWVRDYHHLVHRRGIGTVVSVAPSTAGECARMAGIVASLYPAVLGLELNLSCPNATSPPDQETKLRIAEEACKKMPTILKLSAEDDAVYLAGARPVAVHLVNAVPWRRAVVMRMVSGPSPLEKYGYEGSLSGEKIAPLAAQILSDFVAASPGVPVISGGGVLSAAEARDRFLRGAAAVAFWTAFDVDAGLPNQIIDEVNLGA